MMPNPQWTSPAHSCIWSDNMITNNMPCVGFWRKINGSGGMIKKKLRLEWLMMLATYMDPLPMDKPLAYYLLNEGLQFRKGFLDGSY